MSGLDRRLPNDPGPPVSGDGVAAAPIGTPTQGRSQIPGGPRKPKPAANPLRPPPKPKTRQTGPARSTISKPAVRNNIPSKLLEQKDEDAGLQWTTFPLVTTKASLLKGIRHHVMRLHGNREVNPTNPAEFMRPLRLHRRDPRAPPQGGKGGDVEMKDDDGLTPEEREKQAAERAAKEKEKEETIALIAPHGNGQSQKRNAFKKKTQQVFHHNEDERRLRYEEFFPWHIEDFDNKNTWVGNLEGALSDGTYAMFVMREQSFQMVPIDKWYKFTQRNVFKTLSIEEAEDLMKKKTKPSRWFMEMTQKLEGEPVKSEEGEMPMQRSGMKTVVHERLKGPKKEFRDADELDFDEIFEDDEEAPIVDGDEEEDKTAKNRMKREYLEANFFDTKNEKEWEEEQREEEKLKELSKKGGRKVKKYLKNVEKNHTYDTDDSDANPYLSSDDDSSTDDEARAEEERKRKELEAAAEATRRAEQAAAKGISPKKPKTASNAPSRTESPAPSGPNDGKRKLPTSQGTSTPEPGAREGTPGVLGKNVVKIRVNPQNLSNITSKPPSPSPPPAQLPQKISNKRRKANSGSDYDTEMSDGPDGSAVKKQRLAAPPGGTRSASPANATTPTSSGGPQPPITEEEIIRMFKREDKGQGVVLKEFTKSFRSRLAGADAQRRQDFLTMIKKITKVRNGVIFLKPGL